MSASAYVRYDPSIERKPQGEDEAIEGIVASMSHASEIAAERQGHTTRASHAKSHALLKGRLEVLDGLDPALRQGLFAEPRSYDVVVRMAAGPSELLSDAVTVHRGMAIKVFGVAGEKLTGHGDATQDFVLATGPVFPQPDAAGFLKSMKQIEGAVGRSEGFKRAVATGARALNALTGGSSPTLDFFGHPPIHPLGDRYYSQAAMRFGDHVAKLAAIPASPELVALSSETLDVGRDPDAFRHATRDFLASHEAVFELRVQLCTDLEAMPVEDASKEWDETQSPYVTVARIVLPAQDAYAAERQRFMDEAMSFRPAHSLVAHQPLGSLMRARLVVYERLAAFRQGRNGVSPVEPSGLDQITD